MNINKLFDYIPQRDAFFVIDIEDHDVAEVLPEFENSKITKYFENDSALFSALDDLPNDAALRLSLLLSGTDGAVAKEACRRLKLSHKLTDAVSETVASLALPCPMTEADVRRFMVRLGERAEGALLLGRACRAERAADTIGETSDRSVL